MMIGLFSIHHRTQPSVGCEEARLAQRVQPRQQLNNHPNNHQCNATVKTPTNKTDTQRSRYDNINQACNGSVCKKGGASGPSSRKLYKVKRGKSRTNQDEIATKKKRKKAWLHKGRPSRQVDKQHNNQRLSKTNDAQPRRRMTLYRESQTQRQRRNKLGEVKPNTGTMLQSPTQWNMQWTVRQASRVEGRRGTLQGRGRLTTMQDKMIQSIKTAITVEAPNEVD